MQGTAGQRGKHFGIRRRQRIEIREIRWVEGRTAIHPPKRDIGRRLDDLWSDVAHGDRLSPLSGGVCEQRHPHERRVDERDDAAIVL